MLRACLPILTLVLLVRPNAHGQAVFELNDVSVRPGQSEVTMQLSIFPDADPVYGYGVALSYDPTVMAVSAIESSREADFSLFHPGDDFSEPGLAGLSVVYSFEELPARVLSAAEGGPVATVSFCVSEAAVRGSHHVQFVPELDTVNGTKVRTFYTTMDEVTPDEPPQLVSREPLIEHGEVAVSGEALQDSPCPPPEEPTMEPQVSFALAGPASVRQGEQIAVEWKITSNVDVVGYSAALEFDETAVSLVDVIPNEAFLDRSPSINWHCVGSGEAALLIVPWVDDAGFLPAGEAREAATLVFDVSGQVATGFTEIRFREFASCDRDDVEPFENPRLGVWNRVGVAVGDGPNPDLNDLDVEVETEGQGAGFAIVAPAVFVRGDADGNSIVEITDAVTILNQLFVEGAAPNCLDAADADDSGHLDITDPIRILNYLFLGGITLPAPGPVTPGFDPTPDNLDCVNDD